YLSRALDETYKTGKTHYLDCYSAMALRRVWGAARGKADNDAHRPRGIGLRPRDGRNSRQRGSARGEMQELSAGKFHSALLAFRTTAGFPQSLRLDVRGPDHLAPLLGFVGDELAELDRRSRQRRAAEVSETGLHLRVAESRVDLLVELVDDSAGVAFGAPRPYQIPPS